MKRCPECRRDYFDDSLLYCLDDGTALLEGPGSLEPQTAVLSDDKISDRSLTRQQPTGESAKHPHAETLATANFSTAEHVSTTTRRRSRFVIPTAIAAFVLFGMIAFVGFRSGYFSNASRAAFEKIKVSRATNEGNVQSVAASPDGKYIAYVTIDGATRTLWTKHLATNSRVRIASPAGATDLVATVFSPDSNYVFYAVQETGRSAYDLYQVPVLGGSAKRVTSDVSLNVSFSPDGKQIGFSRYDPVSTDSFVLIANADGSNERVVASRKVPEVVAIWGVSWSPDGETFATDYMDSSQDTFVASINIADGSVKQLSSKKFNSVGSVKWLPGGTSVVFVAQEQASEANKIWHLNLANDLPSLITVDLNSYGASLVPTDNASIFSLARQSSSSIYVSEISTPNNVRRVSNRSGVNDGVWGLSWDKNGRLFSVSQDENKSETWMIEPGATSPTTLMTESAADTVTVSPDGKYLVFISKRTGAWHIWRTDIHGGDAKQLTSIQGVTPGLSITPDGKWILFTTVNPGIQRVSIDGGEVTQFAATPLLAYAPRISPDGSYLAYEMTGAENKPQVFISKLNGNEQVPFKTFDLPPTFAGRLQWAPDSRSVIYSDTVGQVSNLWEIALNTGTPRQLTSFTSEVISNFALSLDGKQIALSRGPVSSDAVLITDSK